MKFSKSVFRIFSILIMIGMIAAMTMPVYAGPTQNSSGPNNFESVDPADVRELVVYPDGVDKAVKGASGLTRFILTLDDSSVASYDGRIEGFEATSPLVTGDLKLDVSSPESRSYIDYLELEQADVIGSIETVINRNVDVIAQYSVALMVSLLNYIRMSY